MLEPNIWQAAKDEWGEWAAARFTPATNYTEWVYPDDTQTKANVERLVAELNKELTQ